MSSDVKLVGAVGRRVEGGGVGFSVIERCHNCSVVGAASLGVSAGCGVGLAGLWERVKGGFCGWKSECIGVKDGGWRGMAVVGCRAHSNVECWVCRSFGDACVISKLLAGEGCVGSGGRAGDWSVGV